jgi:hypothetical protein
MCAELGKVEGMVRQNRAGGESIDRAKAIVAALVFTDPTMDEQVRRIVGAGAFMVIDHVYSDRGGDVYSRCLDENWPLSLYLATL